MSGFRLNIASKNTKRSRGVISFGCPFLFLQINYAFQIHGAQPLFKIKIALYICWKTFCSFFFVQFHCVGPTHKEVTFCSKWRSYCIFAVKKVGQKCSFEKQMVFFSWRKFIILNASQSCKTTRVEQKENPSALKQILCFVWTEISKTT